jgi:hypothetical protein
VCNLREWGHAAGVLLATVTAMFVYEAAATELTVSGFVLAGASVIGANALVCEVARRRPLRGRRRCRAVLVGSGWPLVSRMRRGRAISGSVVCE